MKGGKLLPHGRRALATIPREEARSNYQSLALGAEIQKPTKELPGLRSNNAAIQESKKDSQFAVRLHCHARSGPPDENSPVHPSAADAGKLQKLRPNPSLKRSANGKAPGPGCGEVHSPQPGPGALPLATA
jgi:hypothetical protein